MPTISLSFPSFLNTPISSYFLTNTNNSNVSTSKESQTPPTTTHPPTPSPSPSPPPTSRNPEKAMDAVGLRRVFNMFDLNGDGRISMNELTQSLGNMGIVISDADLAQMINRIDANGDGCVDGEEFQALYRLIMEREGDDQDEEEDEMKEAFNIFDKNGDGYISVDELRTVLGSLGLAQGRNIEDCKLMIMKVDGDGDGRVSYNEFKNMMKNGGFASLN